MATAEVLGAVAPAGAVQFLGDEGAYWRLRVKGAALVMVTLGIYRFWLATDVRRFLWANTEIAGDTLEYNGLATELLVGFLYAIAILVPLYTAVGIVALELGAPGGTSAIVGFLLLAVLGEYALYRARRYRLTRTVFRGLRFNQYGSAWHYAFYALVWWGVVILTLGLAYPWAQASLQRFKMRNTSYGDLPGRFEGSGSALFWRGLPMWLLVVGPLLFAIVALVWLIDWDTLNNAMAQSNSDAWSKLKSAPEFRRAIRIAVAACLVGVVFAALLYPLFQAMMLRWWISGLRFGDVAVTLAVAHRAGVPHLYSLRSLYFSARPDRGRCRRRVSVRRQRAARPGPRFESRRTVGDCDRGLPLCRRGAGCIDHLSSRGHAFIVAPRCAIGRAFRGGRP